MKWWRIKNFILYYTVWRFFDPNNGYHRLYGTMKTSSKWKKGHCLGCVWWAPSDRCICASLEKGEYQIK